MPVKGALTRQEMEAVINGGGAVIIGNQVHSQVATLPPESELAGNDMDRLTLHEQSLDDQIAQLQREKMRTADQRERAAKGDSQREDADRRAAQLAAQQEPDTAKLQAEQEEALRRETAARNAPLDAAAAKAQAAHERAEAKAEAKAAEGK